MKKPWITKEFKNQSIKRIKYIESESEQKMLPKKGSWQNDNELKK